MKTRHSEQCLDMNCFPVSLRYEQPHVFMNMCHHFSTSFSSLRYRYIQCFDFTKLKMND